MIEKIIYQIGTQTNKKLMIFIIELLDLKFNVTQYRWGRKLYRGTWYYIDPKGLSMAPFWSDTEITSCQSQTLGIERY